MGVGPFIVFCVVAAFLGGASRADELALVLFRPIGIGLLGWVLWSYPLTQFRHGRAFCFAIIGLIVICTVQLIPLPPSIWTALPGRGEISAIDRLIFGVEIWRPITVSPRATWNTLFSLLSLLGGYLAFLALAKSNNNLALKSLLAISIISIMLSIVNLQFGHTIFPLYSLAGIGEGGLFSNSNHFGIFSAISILVAVILIKEDSLTKARQARWYAFLALVLLFLVGVVLSGSRLAFAASAFACMIAAMVFARNLDFSNATNSQSGLISRALGLTAHSRWPGRFLLFGFYFSIIGCIATFLYVATLQRELSIGSFEAPDLSEDIRFRIIPVLLKLATEQWATGFGFGSFGSIYPVYETDDIMINKYVNQAHNDGLQIVIEGGIAAGLVAIGLLIWLALRIVSLFRSGDVDRGLVAIGVVAVIGLGSVFDYVLRTPLMAFAIMCILTVLLSSKPSMRSEVCEEHCRKSGSNMNGVS
ncbi:O-antigen ligase family protein [Alteripontixanthobacter maritimus]|nr:O-antigen ligase family protein [Alteripontixanthobacter maritimus]